MRRRLDGISRSPWGRCAVACLPLLCALVLAWISPSAYLPKVGTLVGVAALQAMSLNMIWGFGGQLSMGQMAITAIGAYVSTLSVTMLGVDPWLSAVPALGVALCFTLLLGALALRLRGFYFSIVTLAFSQVLLVVIYNADIVGGPSGLVVTHSLSDIRAFGRTVLRMDVRGQLILAGLVVSLLLLAQFAVVRSRPGRAIVAIREEEILARSIGIEPTRYKILAFLLSSVPAALAGWLMAPVIGYLLPTGFGIESLLDQISMVVIGGAGTVLGPFAGAIVVVLLPEMLRFAGAMRVVAYSVILILAVIFAPRGLAGFFAARSPAPGAPARREREPDADPAGPAVCPPAPAGERTLLEVEGLAKRYGGIKAVSNVSLSLRAGEAMGLIGPNGAGKTTLFDMISGFVAPSAGSVRWLDVSGQAPERLAAAGLVRTFQHARVFPNLTVVENLMTAAHLPGRRLFGVSRAEDRVACVLNICGLAEWADVTASEMPYGVGKRLGVALGLIAEPILLMLDEPAAGLTTIERQALAALLGRIQELGVATLVIDHDIAFVGLVCRRVVVLAAGEIICDGDIEHVRADPAVIDAYLGMGAETADAAKIESPDAAR